MKVLFDENVPVKSITDLGDEYEQKTVRDMGWLGKKNGELLGLMVLNGIDFFVTLDRNLQYQQNLAKFDIVVFKFTINENHGNYNIN